MPHALGSFSAFVEPGRMGTVAHSTVRLFTEIPIQIHVRATLTTSRGWSRMPGAYDLTGHIHLRALGAEFLFRRNPDADFTPSSGNRAITAIVAAGHAIPIPSQRISFSARGGSDVWLRVSDPGRQPPWTEHFVGRSLGHPLMFDRHIVVQGILDANFTPEEFPEGPRTRVQLSGELRFERAVVARFLVRDPLQLKLPLGDAYVGEAVMLPEGTAVSIGRQSVWGLVGPSPWISLRILAADGTMVGDEHMLGRSVRMQ